MDIEHIKNLVRNLDFKKLQYAGKSLKDFMDEFEKVSIETTLKDEKVNGNISIAARFLGIERTTLKMKLKKYGL